MYPISLDGLFSIVGVVVFGVLLVYTALSWRLRDTAIIVLSLYLLLGLAWNIGTMAQVIGLMPDALPDEFFTWLTNISRGLMVVVFGALTPVFLSKNKEATWYTGVALALFSLGLVVRFQLNNIDSLIIGAIPAIQSTAVIIGILEVVTWTLAAVIAPWTILSSLKQRRQTQFRNRIRYWSGGVIILAAANLIILLQNPNLLWIGMGLNILSALLITHITLHSHLPDLQIITSHIIRTVAVTLSLCVIIFVALYGAYLANDGLMTRQVALAAILAIAILLALILPRFANWLEESLTKLLLEAGFDVTRTLKAYSQTVSTEWDFDKLGRQALSFVVQEMKIDRGVLFINEGDGAGHVTLNPTAVINMPEINTGYFFANDPWIMYLRYAQTSVTQYDIDVLPEYKKMDDNSKDWLANQDVEIFFPIILRQRELLGVLALGPKPSNRPYLESDIDRLHVLASQIALDIDKTKMFNQLGSVNQKLGEMSKKFENLDQGKADFLSIASHELRTPLTHIHGYASMLMEATEAELQDPAYLQHVFTGIAKGSNRLKDIVDLIFDVSKADIGEMDLNLGPVSLASIVREAAENQGQPIQQRQHRLVISGLEQLPIIQGDSQRLVQSLDHLINNAVKYTPDGGTITITGRSTTENQRPCVELIITDTGIGIDPDDHTRIFEKFYRVGNIENHSSGSVKFKGAGPGLGLPLVAGIAQAHGGKVWVESPKYDEKTCPGSQFHLVLPVEPVIEMLKEAHRFAEPSTVETRHWRSEDMQAVRDRIAEQQKKSA